MMNDIFPLELFDIWFEIFAVITLNLTLELYKISKLERYLLNINLFIFVYYSYITNTYVYWLYLIYIIMMFYFTTNFDYPIENYEDAEEEEEEEAIDELEKEIDILENNDEKIDKSENSNVKPEISDYDKHLENIIVNLIEKKRSEKKLTEEFLKMLYESNFKVKSNPELTALIKNEVLSYRIINNIKFRKSGTKNIPLSSTSVEWIK